MIALPFDEFVGSFLPAWFWQWLGFVPVLLIGFFLLILFYRATSAITARRRGREPLPVLHSSVRVFRSHLKTMLLLLGLVLVHPVLAYLWVNALIPTIVIGAVLFLAIGLPTAYFFELRERYKRWRLRIEDRERYKTWRLKHLTLGTPDAKDSAPAPAPDADAAT